jgi:cyanophycinase-like exopeptidase
VSGPDGLPAPGRERTPRVSGPIGLHGGGEYLDGDEPFLDALIGAAVAGRASAAGRALAAGPDPDSRPLRIVIVPTAAARGMPDRAAADGRRAFDRRATACGTAAEIEVARVVDAASAAEPAIAGSLDSADLIHLPGGDPDLIPTLLAGSAALAAIRAAWTRGAVVAGASAGAMALADWTWTPDGGVRGLGFVPGLAVVPHYDDVRRTRWQAALDELAPGGIGYLGLDEQTGVLAAPSGSDGWSWRVAGSGAASWFARGARQPLIGRDGDVLRLPG